MKRVSFVYANVFSSSQILDLNESRAHANFRLDHRDMKIKKQKEQLRFSKQ